MSDQPPSRWSHSTDSRPTTNFSSGRYSGTSDNVKEAHVGRKLTTNELATVASSGNDSRDVRLGLVEEKWDEKEKQIKIEREILEKERLENKRPEKEILEKEHKLDMDEDWDREKKKRQMEKEREKMEMEKMERQMERERGGSGGKGEAGAEGEDGEQEIIGRGRGMKFGPAGFN